MNNQSRTQIVENQKATLIRDARPDEVEVLSALCMRSKAHWGYPPDFLEACRETLTLTAERLSRERVRVADCDGQVVGVSSLSIQETQGEVELLFVEPRAMRRGVGRALMEDLVGAARTARARVVWILADHDAESFYVGCGALRVGERPSDAIEGRTLPWLRLWLGGPVPELHTERLRLRAWRTEDRAPFAALNADPRTMRYLAGTLSRARSDEVAQRLSEHLERQGFGLWAVERTDVPGAPFIGFIGFNLPGFDAHFTPCVEIGWRLDAAHWRQGLASEGAAAVLRFGFEEVQLDEVVSFTTVGNAASRRVMEKIGLVRDARSDFDHPALPPGHPHRPHVLYRKRR